MLQIRLPGRQAENLSHPRDGYNGADQQNDRNDDPSPADPKRPRPAVEHHQHEHRERRNRSPGNEVVIGAEMKPGQQQQRDDGNREIDWLDGAAMGDEKCHGQGTEFQNDELDINRQESLPARRQRRQRCAGCRASGIEQARQVGVGVVSEETGVAALVLGEYTIANNLLYPNLQVEIVSLARTNAGVSIAVAVASLLFAFVLLVALSFVGGGPRRQKMGVRERLVATFGRDLSGGTR